MEKYKAKEGKKVITSGIDRKGVIAGPKYKNKRRIKMKSRKYWMLVTLFFMVVTFLSSNVLGYDMAEYCPLNQGDEWSYFDTNPHNGFLPLRSVINGTELVNGVETIKFFEGGSEDANCYAMDSEGLKLYKWYLPPGYLIFDPPSIIFPAQFDVGESYQESLSASCYSPDDDTLKYTLAGNRTVTLELVEDVIVMAGTFKDCLKISTSATLQRESDLMITEMESTSWYARNVGPIKSISSKPYPIRGELVSATVDGVHYGCPATFALGGDTNDLNTLRKFRDEVLRKTAAGQEIIRLYYEWSPIIVKVMEEDEEFKEQVKEMIDGILPLIR